MTVDAERLTPILQCTRHLEWFFLQQDKQENKSHVTGYGSVMDSLKEGQRSLLCPPCTTALEGRTLEMMRARRRIPVHKSWELEMGSLIHFRDHHASIQVFGYWDHWEKTECRDSTGFDRLCLQRQLGQVQHRYSWSRSNTDTAGAAPERLQKRKHPHFLSEAKQSSDKNAGLEQVNASPGRDRARGRSRNWNDDAKALQFLWLCEGPR